MAVFASRQIVMPATTIAVTITGTGNVNKCYATINGTKQYSAGTYEVNAGDTITFGVAGISSPNYGSVIINKTKVLTTTGGYETQTYDWTVPNGISTVEITMSYDAIGIGTITVTTA